MLKNVNASYDRKVPEDTAHCSLLHMGLHGHRPISVPMLTLVDRLIMLTAKIYKGSRVMYSKKGTLLIFCPAVKNYNGSFEVVLYYGSVKPC